VTAAVFLFIVDHILVAKHNYLRYRGNQTETSYRNHSNDVVFWSDCE